jgi:hypothetical protein
VRAAWGLPERALRRRLRLLPEERLRLPDRAERRRRFPAPVASSGRAMLRMSLGPTCRTACVRPGYASPSSRLVVSAIHRSMEAPLSTCAYVAASANQGGNHANACCEGRRAPRLAPAMQ